MLEELAKHWEDLGKQQTDGGQMIAEMEDRREGFGLDMCEMVTWQQVLDVVRCLRRGKSPGPDCILNVMMVYGGFRLMETLAQLMNLTMTEEYVPSEWRKSFVVPLYKSEDPEVACNYRGIWRWVVVWLKSSLGW